LPTAAHARALIGGLLLSVVGVLARRPDLVVLAAPLVCVAMWAMLRRPTIAPLVHQSIGHVVLREGQATRWHVTVEDHEGMVDEIATMLKPVEWAELEPLSGEAVISLRDDDPEAFDVAIRSTRWGRRRTGPAMVVASSAWAAFRFVSRDEDEARALLTLPAPSAFDAAAPPVRSPGLVGGNRSPRQGDGTEFASIRPFQPGDRLRRIHWRQSLRAGALHVSASWADHDRHLVLLLDALDDVGESEGIDGKASSLDICVRAAAAVAEHHIGVGDRVAMVLIGARGVQRMPPATGHRHLRRMLEVMAGITPATSLIDDGRMLRGLGNGALVVMLSPLVSPLALQRAVRIASHGFTIVVVDCLPADVAQEDPDDPFVGLAWRIELLHRERAIRRVREAGIPVVPWRGPGSLDTVLRDLHRQPSVRVRR
jgi:uncharacterized protein (DUF58 family)